VTSVTALAWGLAAACAVGWAGSLAGGASERLRRPGGDTAKRLFALLSLRLGGSGAPADLSRRLLRARVPAWLGPAEAMALKSAAAAAAALLALLAAPSLPGRLGLVALAAGPALGFVALDLVLVRRARRRASLARAEAPELLDRVRMLADAGLAPAEALARAARGGSGPLSAELRALAAAARLGEGRAAGLERLRCALPVPEAQALAAAVVRCERHGVPLGPEVAALAAGARAERSRLVRDRAERAAPKIQLVVALLLVPAVLLLVAAGLLAGLR
jgi:tight adherence protein C